MPDWQSPGMSWAYNDVEMLPGFGITKGPGGFPLEDDKSIAVPLRIPIGQHVEMTIKTDIKGKKEKILTNTGKLRSKWSPSG